MRKREAARRGRAGEDVVDGDDELDDVRLIRAASWLRDGGLRLRSDADLGAWIEACSDWLDGTPDMVYGNDDGGRLCRRAPDTHKSSKRVHELIRPLDDHINATKV